MKEQNVPYKQLLEFTVPLRTFNFKNYYSLSLNTLEQKENTFIKIKGINYFSREYANLINSHFRLMSTKIGSVIITLLLLVNIHLKLNQICDVPYRSNNQWSFREMEQ